MLSPTENLIVVAMEECNEIGQELSKVLRFGPDDHHPYDKPFLTNGHRVMKEYYQLQAVISLLQEDNVLPILTLEEQNEIMAEKVNKVKHWSDYSRKKGIID